MRSSTFLLLAILSWGLSAGTSADSIDWKSWDKINGENMLRDHNERVLRAEQCNKDLTNLYPKIGTDVIWGICTPFIDSDEIEKFYNPKFMVCWNIFKEAMGHSNFSNCDNSNVLEASQKPGFGNCLTILMKNEISDSGGRCSDDKILKGSQQFGYSHCLDFLKKAGDDLPDYNCSNKEILEASLTPQFPLCFNILKKEDDSLPAFNCRNKKILEASQKPGFAQCLRILKKAGNTTPSYECQDDLMIEASHKPEFILCLAAEKEVSGDPIYSCLKDEKFKKFRLNGQQEIDRARDGERAILDFSSRPKAMNATAVPEKEVEDGVRSPGDKKQLPSSKIKSLPSTSSKKK